MVFNPPGKRLADHGAGVRHVTDDFAFFFNFQTVKDTGDPYQWRQIGFLSFFSSIKDTPWLKNIIKSLL